MKVENSTSESLTLCVPRLLFDVDSYFHSSNSHNQTMDLCFDLTIAIPTYNGEHRLPELLERLRNQINTEHFS